MSEARVWMKVSVLKGLYKTIRKLHEENERYLRIINRWRMEKEEEEKEYPRRKQGTDRYKGLFNFRF